MSPIQQMLLGVGAVATKTYVDDVFSTFLYEGNATARSINNGVDLSGQGGLVWIKNRDATFSNRLYDTVRGATKHLKSDSNAEESTGGQTLTAFNSNGFSLGTDSMVNSNNDDTASWSFRKAPGFFDVKTWDGNSTAGRQISHDLGCVPGLIMVKSTNNTGDWMVYHRGVGNEYRLKLNSTTDKGSGTASWNDTTPTSTYVELGGNTGVNATGTSYVGYFFAGGESSAATARSVSFNGSSAYLSVPDTNGGWDMGTGAFTIETWFRYDGSSTTSTNDTLLDGRNGTTDYAYYFHVSNAGKVKFTHNAGNFADTVILEGTTVTSPGLWYHAAVSKSGNTIKLFVNGIEEDTASDTKTYNMGSPNIGWRGTGAVGSSLTYWNGLISNFRVVKGTAVYTSSFKPPTEPLTNITNTSLLFCNDSSVTGSTVTTGTITSTGSPTASTDSPFDDPAGFVFGDAGDQGIIKCGSYTTDSNEDATVHLGWEPQWVLAKRTDSSTGGDWFIIDSMRGFMNAQDIEANNGGSKYVEPNTSDAEADTSRMGLTSTGFYADQYGANRSFIYLAIRRPDGYVGKPYGAGEGTSVFAMDTGNGSTDGPAFDSGFPVDMGLRRKPASGNSGTPDTDWATYNRLLGITYLRANTTDVITSSSKAKWDLMTGFNKDDDNTYQAWMWKRHAGFDVVAYGPGNEVEGRSISHSLNKIPEMIWIKNRDTTDHWVVYHKGLNGGTNPEQYYLWLETDNAEDSTSVYWNNTAPTSTHFTVGNGNAVNQNNKNYIAMLFASVDGISKVGYYDGSESEQTITTGFQPRFVIIKRVNNTQNWYVLDTTRGWASGVDQFLQLDTTAAQDNSYDLGAPTSTGFTLTGNNLRTNNGGDKFIYYAHA